MRLLLITRHYPPAVSGGAKRPYLLTRALRQLGAEVFVIAPSLPDNEPGLALPHPNRDPSGAPPTAPTLRDTAREWLLWPDPDIRWCLRAAEAASQAPWTPDWVWTTSPPESIHAAGLRVKQRTGAKWLADFRDHWLERPHRVERRTLHRRAGERALARRWLPRADLATCVDSSIQQELRALGATDPKIAPHFAPAGDAAPVTLSDADINIVHTGSIALSDPEARIADLLSPFEAALARNPTLRLHLVGRLSTAELAAIEESPARARIDVHGVQPFETALGFQRAADALVLVGSRKTHVPPSKITEYLATDAPIIACGEGDWRADARLDGQSARAAFTALRKGEKRALGLRAPNVDQVAAQMLDWMRA